MQLQRIDNQRSIRPGELEGIRQHVFGEDIELNARQAEKLSRLRVVMECIANIPRRADQNQAIAKLLNLSIPYAKQLKKDAAYVFGSPASTTIDIERRRNIGQIEAKIEALEDLQFDLLHARDATSPTGFTRVPLDDEQHQIYLRYEKQIAGYMRQKAELDGSLNHDASEELERLRRAVEIPVIVSSDDPDVLAKQYEHLTEDVEHEDVA